MICGSTLLVLMQLNYTICRLGRDLEALGIDLSVPTKCKSSSLSLLIR